MSPPAPRSRLAVRGLLPHLVWEGVLLLAVLAVGATVVTGHPGYASHGTIWSGLAPLGLVATGLALSFRTGTPNLAVGVIAAMSGWVYAHLAVGGMAAIPAALVAVLLALGVGAFLGVLVGMSSMPGWAVTLAAGFLLQGALSMSGNGGITESVPGADTGTGVFVMWVLLFAVVSVAGGALLALVPRLPALLGANRPDADGVPGRWRVGKLVGALVGLAGSSAAAGLGGVVYATYLRQARPVDTGLLPFALAAVLIGGVSVFGRRGGILGVVLGTVLVGLVRDWVLLDGGDFGVTMLVVALAALAGLGVNRLLEWLDPLAEGPLDAPGYAFVPGPVPAFAPAPPAAPAVPPAVPAVPPPTPPGWPPAS